jgi:uncharacterized protein YbjT (DUF2867 family)
MEIWVAGSTGLIGKAFVDVLLAEPAAQCVTALVRRPSWAAHSKLTELVVDFEQLEAGLAGRTATHVACCLGTTIAKAKTQDAFRRVDFDYPLALARAARTAGAQTFLLVSALGANAKSSVFYNRVKGELEDALTELGFPTLHILRPSLLLGERQEQRTGEQIASVVARPLRHLLVGPLRKFAPIEGDDVARALALLSLAPSLQTGRFVHESDELARLAKAYTARS